MFVKTGKGNWTVQFQKCPVEREGKQCIDTLARLFRFDGTGKKLYSHNAWAHQHPNDTYDKIKGKKIALKRLLETAVSFDKEVRTAFWTEFRKEFKL